MSVSEKMTRLMNAVRGVTRTSSKLSFDDASSLLQKFIGVERIAISRMTLINELKSPGIYSGTGALLTGKPGIVANDDDVKILVFQVVPGYPVQIFWFKDEVWARCWKNNSWKSWTRLGGGSN